MKTKTITFTEKQVERIYLCLQENALYFDLHTDGFDLYPSEKALEKRTYNIKNLLKRKLGQ